jgi:anthranilate phosphoribosyltransferase
MGRKLNDVMAALPPERRRRIETAAALEAVEMKSPQRDETVEAAQLVRLVLDGGPRKR